MAEKQTNKDRMREIVDSIENGIKELFESDKYQQYLSTMSRFHRYSVNNTMLIYMQRPDATHVAGFNKWRDQFGRNVLKGEKGIRIIAPTPYKKKVEEIKTDPETNAPVLDADGKAIIEEKEIRIPMFKVVSVFDVSQTAGKPLPQLAADLSGNVQQYEVFMEALRRAFPVPMEIKPVARDTDGFFSIKAQSITIRAGMSEVQTVCAAVHEIAHAKLHDYEHMTELADDGETILVPGEKSRNTEEVEAESISYAVCQYYGIETGENSFGYIATWSKGKELKELRASLETINKTASELITDIDRHFAEICKERGIDREDLAAAEQPSVEAQEVEKLYMVDNDKYIHVQRSDTGIDYTIYDAGSAKVLDGGVLDGTEQQLSTAALEVCKLHNIGEAAPIRLAPLELLKDLREANELPLDAAEQITGAVAVPTDAADTMLPELEQAVPMPDPTLTVDDMRSYGYLDSDMLPLSKDRAVELLEHDITVYMLYPDNAEEMVFEAEDIIKHDGMFGVTRPDWDAVKGHIPPRDVEQRFLNSPTDSMAIYQLRRDAPVELRFANLGSLAAPPDPANYEAVYTREVYPDDDIRDAFKDWIWKDPDRRETLVRQYNEEMNSTRPREYDGSHIVFSGMNPEITLREHQKNAIAHVLYGGNTLLAHEVGAGKTFEMVASAMESKRLGLCQKSIFVVPNHLTEQWASEFLRLYPSANILVTTKKDFETHNRKKFCARIATGDYDAVIIGHSQFERIPISPERQERLLHQQIEEITDGIQDTKLAGGNSFTIKSLERTKKGLEARLKKLQASDRKDDVIYFEQLGVDRMFVDESDNYKNLFLYTKMRNVAGLSTTDAQKSSDMFSKCRYMDELTGGRGVVFATGTPVSNSMTELYTIQRYLQHDRLQEMGMGHFDCWASRFGETTTALELAPEGIGYRARTRFAKFFNLPELMNLFKEVADIKTADQLHLPTPEVAYHTIATKPTQIQQDMVKALSERASKVHSGAVSPDVDNMLKITSDGRKLGLDQRIINPMLPDEESTKVNQCVANILQYWRDGEADKLTQLVFCDISTPKTAPSQRAAKASPGTLDSPEIHALESAIPLEESSDTPFTVYEDVRQKLIDAGMPPEQIAFIHDANTEVKKRELFAKVRSGQVRVLMGSTAKMGAGTNVQDRLVALHDLDCPWRPRDLTQRKGRIERQGNQNKLVHVCRYVTEGTFDAYLWQTVENKQKFISQIMTSKSPVRSCEDVDATALSFAEIKALCAGDPRIKERMDLDIEVSKLKIMKADHNSKQFRLEDSLLKYFPEKIEEHKGFVRGLEADMQTLAAHPLPAEGFVGMEIRGDRLTDKENAGAALLDTCKEVKGKDPVQIGSYRGFTMSVAFDSMWKTYTLTLKGQMTHRVELGSDARGNLVRIENALDKMPERLRSVQEQLENLYNQQAAAKAEVGKPFPQEQELAAKTARLIELDMELNLDGKGQPQPEQAIAKSARPSVLDRLKAPPVHGAPEKPHKKEMEAR